MLTELRPNKELLDSNFSGYKLSLDAIPVYRKNIVEGVDHVSQDEDQYSFVHTKLFSLHNHLYCDPWHENTVVFVDKKWQVLKAAVSPQTGRLDDIETVWVIPNQSNRRNGHYNASVLFPDKDVALVADGCGLLHVLSRSNNAVWQCELSQEVTLECGSVLMAATLTAEGELHCVLLSLETIVTEETSAAEPNKPRPPTVKSVLVWLTLKKVDSGAWSLECRRQLEGAGAVDYVALEPTGGAVYVASNTSFSFTSDSANPLPPPAENMREEEIQPAYVWQQSEDDIKVIVEVAPEVTRDEVEVKVESKELMIRCGAATVVEGVLLYPVDHKLTTWSLQDTRLEVVLCKQELGLMWTDLVPSDSRGEQLIDPNTVESVHARLSHLCSDTQVVESGEGVAPTFNLDQLEDCDCAPEDNRSVERLEAATHSVSHHISLAGHQWLTTVPEGPECPPCICVRHDVDGCVWRLESPSPTTQEWPCVHVGTFAALGYVAASKTQRKFLTAAPDLSYAVICEVASRVYVYRKSSKVNGELRNRKTAARFETVAKQQLINLESDSLVLGVYASPNYLFILTTDTLHTFHIQ